MLFAAALSAALVDAGVTHVFCVTGGYAQTFNHTFATTKGITVVYTQTENAAGYAALGHAKTTGRPAVVCVTAGCAATNAVTAALDAYQDSTPIIFVSGQVNSSDIAITGGRRHYMGAWCNIVDIVRPCTKWAHEITPSCDLVKVVSDMWAACVSNRPGPVWLSVPLDMQRQVCAVLPPLSARTAITSSAPDGICGLIDRLARAERPVVIVGAGARHPDLRTLLEHWGVPCVFTFLSLDLLPGAHPLNAGRAGIMGDRSGNMTMQNADLLVSLGCRLSGAVRGYNPDLFLRHGVIVAVDIDPTELADLRPGDVGIHADVADVILAGLAAPGDVAPAAWRRKVDTWRSWIRTVPAGADGSNPYTVLATVTDAAPPDTVVVHASGSTFPVLWHTLQCRPGQRFISSSQGDMGFEVPAAIGAACTGRPVLCVVGDGSFHFNIQELQTAITTRRRFGADMGSIVVLVLDNGGLQSIAQSQQAAFKCQHGATPKSGLEVPDLRRVVEAYGVEFMEYMGDGSTVFDSVCGIRVVRAEVVPQERCPKLAVTYDAKGIPTALPIEDMSPLLDWAEHAKHMCVPPIPRS